MISKELKFSFILIFYWIFSITLAQNNNSEIVSLFNNLYQNYGNEYFNLRQSDYEKFCDDFNLNQDSKNNQDTFYKIYFLHDLFTGTDAIDFTSSGAFKIPYFWHWLEPNPRHQILRRSDRKPLTEIPAVGRFSRYKSIADIDRTPSLFLADIFTEEPNYYHPNCREFYTFGWCSEREMAFCLLLNLLEFEGKVYQCGIHVNSKFWLNLVDKSGNPIPVEISVDNTFDIVSWNRVEKEKDEWLKDFGNGEQIDWYNRKAKSEAEIELVKNIQISEKVRERISTLVEDYFDFNAED